MVNTKSQLLDALRADAAGILAFGVARLGLFGSFARDAAGPRSDVDLLVEFTAGQKSLKNLVGLSRHLEALLGRKVELVTPASLNTFIGRHIVQEVENVALAA